MEPLLDEINGAISEHSQPVQIGFMLYELLAQAGYDDEEIQLVSAELRSIAVGGEAMADDTTQH